MFRVNALRAHHHALPHTIHPIRQLWRPNARFNSTLSRPGALSRPLFRYSAYAAGLGVGLAAGSLSVALWRESQLVKQAELDQTRPPTPLRELVRTYVVYSLCSFPTLVDWSPQILETLMKIPIVRNITEAVVRVTFFDQFVGADHADECIPLLKRLRAENKGCLFAYSVEVDETAAGSGSDKPSHGNDIPPHKLAVQEMLKSIDVASKFEDSLGETNALSRKTWIAVKMTALLPDAASLIHLSQDIVAQHSKNPTGTPFPEPPQPSDLEVLSTPPHLSTTSALTQSDVIALRELRDDLILICQRAAERNVKIIMDAEYSWYQPAIDAFVLALQMRFNKLDSDAPSNRVQPLVYQTYQAYLRRTPEYLRQSLSFAQRHSFALGVKLVRGAYHSQEITAHESKGSARSLSISNDVSPPVWGSKPETDKSYDECVTVLIDAVQADITPPTGTSSGGGLRWFARSSSPSSPKTLGTPTIGVLFGTHNHDSCIHILFQLASRGMATDLLSGVLVLPDAVSGRIAMGQLYGMHDQLTNDLVDGTRSTSPFVIKYVPYGALKEVMPYLSRRAIENKSVLFDGAAAVERKRAGHEIWRRIVG